MASFYPVPVVLYVCLVLSSLNARTNPSERPRDKPTDLAVVSMIYEDGSVTTDISL